MNASSRGVGRREAGRLEAGQREAGRVPSRKPLSRARLPSPEECERLLDDYDVPENVRAHLERVARVADHLAEKLWKRGEPVDTELVHCGAVLHDLLKAKCAREDCNHVEEAGRVLACSGYGALARVVECHGLYAVLDDALDSWEAKLVYYADKRVAGDKIVSLNERFEHFLANYPADREKILRAKPLAEKLEDEIFAKLPGVSRGLGEVRAGK